jgi:hypothetical protein
VSGQWREDPNDAATVLVEVARSKLGLGHEVEHEAFGGGSAGFHGVEGE